MNKLDLAGRVAIVTGGVSGIGLAIAQRFAESGATLSLWDRDAAALAKYAKELGAKTKVHTANVDVANYQQVATAAKDALTSLDATTQAISTAANDRRGSLGQAFATNSTCAPLRS